MKTFLLRFGNSFVSIKIPLLLIKFPLITNNPTNRNTHPASSEIKLPQFSESKCIDERKVSQLVESVASQNLQPLQVPDRVEASTELRLDSGEAKVSELERKRVELRIKIFKARLLTLQQLSTLRYRRNVMCLRIICRLLSVTASVTAPKSRTFKFS